MRHDRSSAAGAAVPTRVLLATDSADPSGVGNHMIALAAHLGPQWLPSLAFREGVAAAAFVARAQAQGLEARQVAPAGWDDLLSAHPGVLHVHAGIGWEGLSLVPAGRAAGWTVVRSEHLPFLITDPRQRQDHVAMLPALDALITVSPSAAATWTDGLSLAGSAPPLTVVRNGVVPSFARHSRRAMRAALGVSELSPLILHVARFSPQKAHRTLVDAFQTVARAHPAARLMLVGSGELQQDVADQVTEAGLTGVTICGPRDDVPDLMAAADLLVLPSLFEGLPLVVLEAMSAGLPIVASRIGGVTDALGADYPFLVPPGAADDLAQAILARLSDPAGSRTEARRQQTRFADSFTAARMAAETAAVYRRSLQARPPRARTAQMQRTTRIGFIGAGGIAQRHLEVLRRFPDVQISAVTDTDQCRASDVAGRFGAKPFDDAAAMLADGNIDALFICVPPFAHGPAERAAIRAGVPFFVEKPITRDLALAEELAEQIASAGLVTAVGYHWRYLDTVDRARRALQDKPVQLIVGHWLDSTPPPEWWGRDDASGGQMVEQVTHLIDTARFLAGGVDRVHAFGNHLPRTAFPTLDVATASVATLHFEQGAVATFSSTCLLDWNHRAGLHLFAEGLAIELSDREVMIDTGAGRHPVPADGDPVWREDRDFIDAVRGGPNRIRTTYSDALETHRIALAIAESMRSGAVVRLSPAAATTPAPGAMLRHEPAAPDQHRRIRSLGVEAPGRAAFFDYEEGPAGPGQVRLDTVMTGLSAGTELTFLKNTNPYLSASWDAEAGVFRHGPPAMQFPVPFLGYMEVGRVIDSHVEGLRPGALLAGSWGHKTGHTADPARDLLVALPDSFDPILGVFVAQMGPIAANGILHADALAQGRSEVPFGSGVAGRRVVVWGGGTVGLLTALFARSAGAAEVVIAEPSEFRRHAAERLGFVAEPEEEAWQLAKSWGTPGDHGCDLVFQTRAQSSSLHLALRALRPQGTVIDLAFYQGGLSETRLGEEFHHNALRLVAAQIGRVPAGLAEAWPRARLSAQTLALLEAEGAAMRGAMITHVVPFDEAPAFLSHLIADRPEFLQIVFEVP